MLLCFLVVAIDGFDTAAVSFIAPALRGLWKLAPAQLAPLFGAGLFGLMIGAFIFGPLADRIGRKPVLVVTTAFFGLATIASAFAGSIETLTILRFVTSLGLGGAVLQDIWQPARAIAIIRQEGASFTMASTPFLTDLTQAVETSGLPVPTLRTFLCAGAPIPTPLVEQARTVLGTKIVSAWGMTENGAVTLTRPADDDERSFNTDGLPLPGAELKIVDFNGDSLPAGQTGRLLVRSCSNFGGYLKRPQWNETDEQDWFDTGDIAKLDDQGYVRISRRSKDVIIRGGENVPVVEIESLLYRHPAIAQVAIVGFPDPRLGERACAFVALKPDQDLDLPGMVAYLKSQTDRFSHFLGATSAVTARGVSFAAAVSSTTDFTAFTRARFQVPNRLA